MSNQYHTLRYKLDQRGIKPKEGCVMSDTINNHDVITSYFEEVDITIAIDDFGTGFSSMAQLKKMPLDELKIDKSFVLDLNNDEDDEVIVKSTVELAHNLGLSVVAEGVEDLLTLKKLTGFGCDVAQGYFIAKPMTAENFMTWWDPDNLRQLISQEVSHD